MGAILTEREIFGFIAICVIALMCAVGVVLSWFQRTKRAGEICILLWAWSFTTLLVTTLIGKSMYGEDGALPLPAIVGIWFIAPLAWIGNSLGLTRALAGKIPKSISRPAKVGCDFSAKAIAKAFALIFAFATFVGRSMLWLIGAAIVAAIAYMIVKGVSALPVSLAIVIGALIIAAALSRK